MSAGHLSKRRSGVRAASVIAITGERAGVVAFDFRQHTCIREISAWLPDVFGVSRVEE